MHENNNTNGSDGKELVSKNLKVNLKVGTTEKRGNIAALKSPD